jgi:VanZ family protein
MLLPQPPAAADTGWDKLNHVLAFAGPCFAGLAARAGHGWRSAGAIVSGLLLWGALLEGLQSLLPPRSAEWLDLLSDAVGIAAGALVYAGARRLLRAAAG